MNVHYLGRNAEVLLKVVDLLKPQQLPSSFLPRLHIGGGWKICLCTWPQHEEAKCKNCSVEPQQLESWDWCCSLTFSNCTILAPS